MIKTMKIKTQRYYTENKLSKSVLATTLKASDDRYVLKKGLKSGSEDACLMSEDRVNRLLKSLTAI